MSEGLIQLFKGINVDFRQFLCLDKFNSNLPKEREIVITNPNASINSKSLAIFVENCNEAMDPGCSSVLENGFDNLTLQVSIPIFHLDVKDYNEPVKLSSVSKPLQMNKDFYSTQTISLMTNKLITDDGFILENITNKSFYTLGDVEFQYSPVSKDSRVIGEVIFQSPKEKLIYQRTYLKVQEVIANVGGFLKGLLLLANSIVSGYSQYVLKRTIMLEFKDVVTKQEVKRISLTVKRSEQVESRQEVVPDNRPELRISKWNYCDFLAYEYRKLFSRKQEDLEVYMDVIDFKKNYEEILNLKEETLELREMLEQLR